MKIFPAIDLIDGNAVRLLKGDYDKKTIYSSTPLSVAKSFEEAGAKFLHIVDLDGAKSGGTPNLDTIKEIVKNTSLFVEVGGGIRSMDIIDKYIGCGVGRVILGTVAVTNPDLIEKAVKKYGDKIAVGADIKEGHIAIKGWTQTSLITTEEFFARMCDKGVKTIICTDISKDGAMKGTNLSLYKALSEKFSVNIVASGGVSSIEDVKELKKMNLYAAIVGKAYYVGAIDLKQAIEVAS